MRCMMHRFAVMARRWRARGRGRDRTGQDSSNSLTTPRAPSHLPEPATATKDRVPFRHRSLLTLTPARPACKRLPKGPDDRSMASKSTNYGNYQSMFHSIYAAFIWNWPCAGTTSASVYSTLHLY